MLLDPLVWTGHLAAALNGQTVAFYKVPECSILYLISMALLVLFCWKLYKRGELKIEMSKNKTSNTGTLLCQPWGFSVQDGLSGLILTEVVN